MEATPSTRPTPESKNRGGAGRWIAAVLLVIGIVVALVAIGIFETASPILSVIKSLPEIAGKFKTGTITTTFKESIPEVTSTQGDILELATSRSDEFFRREDSMSILRNTIFLGATVSEIRVPVTFRYHVRLSDSWRLAARGNVCVVLAPRVRPSQPPAIHTDLMEKMSENGWARFNKEHHSHSRNARFRAIASATRARGVPAVRSGVCQEMADEGGSVADGPVQRDRRGLPG
jgi:hypothetical protein